MSELPAMVEMNWFRLNSVISAKAEHSTHSTLFGAKQPLNLLWTDLSSLWFVPADRATDARAPMKSPLAAPVSLLR